MFCGACHHVLRRQLHTRHGLTLTSAWGEPDERWVLYCTNSECEEYGELYEAPSFELKALGKNAFVPDEAAAKPMTSEERVEMAALLD